MRITSNSQACPSCGTAIRSEVKVGKPAVESSELDTLKMLFVKYTNNDFEVSKENHRAKLLKAIDSLEVPSVEDILVATYGQLMIMYENLPDNNYNLESALIEKLKKIGRALLITYPSSPNASAIQEDLEFFDSDERTNNYIGSTLVVVSIAMIVLIFVLLAR